MRRNEQLESKRSSSVRAASPQDQHPKKTLLRTLVDMLGRSCVEKLIAQFGGTRIWVPVRSTPEAKLTQVLGQEAASALCSRFGGDYLQVPNTLVDDNVCLQAAELHRQGCKINDIALAIGRSRRTVFRLLSKKITDLHRPARSVKDPNPQRGNNN
jgi:hypothetical protein